MSKKKKKFERIDGYIPETKSLGEKLTALNLKELEHISNIDMKFKRLIIKFVTFLRNEDFTISIDALIKFFKLYKDFDVFEIEDIKFTLKMLLCKNREQYKIFEKYFEMFFFGVSDLINEEYTEKIKNELIKSTTSKLLQDKEEKKKTLEEEHSIVESQLKEKELEIEQNKAEIKREKEEFLKNSQSNNFSYRRKKEDNEDELKHWINSNNSELEQLIDNADLSEVDKSDIRKLLSLSQNDILKMLKEDTESKFNRLKESLNIIMMENILKGNDTNFNNLCLTASNILVKNKAFIEKKNKEFQNELEIFQDKLRQEDKKIIELNKKLNQNKDRIKKELTQFDQKIGSLSKDIEKELSTNHRPFFTKGKNSVKVKTNVDLLNSDIEKLNDNQYEILTDIIKSNSSKFRTRLSRSMIRFKSKRFNYKNTMQKSLKTFGVPLELCYEKPKTKKTKIVCILDVSGSCAKSSKLLLRFIYELASVFKGGVKSYVFVKDLADVSEYFINYHINDAIEQSLASVPRTYSDYHHALRSFNELYLGEIDKSTIVLFLGDARNNKNESGIEYLSNIKKRAKSVIWLNTEEKPKWNVNDSIIGEYSEYINEVHEILTTNDLIKFLEGFKIK